MKTKESPPQEVRFRGTSCTPILIWAYTFLEVTAFLLHTHGDPQSCREGGVQPALYLFQPQGENTIFWFYQKDLWGKKKKKKSKYNILEKQWQLFAGVNAVFTMNCNFPPQHSSEQLFAKSSIYFPSSDHIPRSEAKIIHVDRKFRENRPERLLFHYEELMFDMTSLIKLYRLNERDFEKYILFFLK